MAKKKAKMTGVRADASVGFDPQTREWSLKAPQADAVPTEPKEQAEYLMAPVHELLRRLRMAHLELDWCSKRYQENPSNDNAHKYVQAWKALRGTVDEIVDLPGGLTMLGVKLAT